MKIGLIGLPMTGKTTFFNLLTNAGEASGASHGRTEANIGTARIHDHRIDYLSGIFKPKKTTYAALDVIDIHGITTGSGTSAAHFLEAVRSVDALVHVVRVFRDDDIPHVDGSINPIRDIETVNMELQFADLAIIETRIQRIETGKKSGKELMEELAVLKRCKDCLEGGRLIHSLGLSDEEKSYLKSFNFLTERPMMLLMNLDEEQFRSGVYTGKEAVAEYASEKHIPVVEVCARTELEISQLEEEDRKLFMEDLGISEMGINRLAAAMYDYLGLISFLTVGEDEVRAWTIKKGTTAKAAGGKIHSDIERGFIRAEVIKYSDFESVGNIHRLREKGLVKLEGKDSVIEDGDIINFRFNV